jgi:hypothetical protein
MTRAGSRLRFLAQKLIYGPDLFHASQKDL